MTAASTAAEPLQNLPSRLVLYDGVCGFCNASIQFILARDPAGSFHFAPLQGPTAAELRAIHAEIPQDIDTIVLLEDGKVFMRSEAALRVAGQLSGPIVWVRWLGVLPRFVTDLGYKFIAAIRYRIWGKLEACPVPSKAQRTRFLP